MIDAVCQSGICVLGVASAVLVSTRRLRWHGFLCGLLAQPFWYVSAYRAGHWGVFFVSFIYTAAKINGLRNSRATKVKEKA